MKIAHILGGWSPNIGNAFFQLGGDYVLKNVFPNSDIIYINEQLGYPSYWNPKGGNPKDSFDISSHINTDYLIIMGPCFRPEFLSIWEKSIKEYIKKGTKIVILGAGAMDYSPSMINVYIEFLKQYPIHLITTRDDDTYNSLGKYVKNAYNGIDFGFFVSDFYKPKGLEKSDDYITLNFDKIPEPRIKIYPSNEIEKNNNFTFEFDKYFWEINPYKFRQSLATKNRIFMLLEGYLFPGNKIKKIGNYQVIRTDHRYAPIFKRKTFRYPNVLVNDTPYPYLEIYGNTKLTLTNRLHAAVATLAYGNPAYLISQSPRIRLLERVGLKNINQHPVTLDKEKLIYEKENLIQFIRENI